MDTVARLGCIACRKNGITDSPATLHHIREGQGGSQRASNWEVIPLCHPHHQGGDGTASFNGEVAFHLRPLLFEEKFGTEMQLLEQTLRESGRADLIPVYVKHS